MQNHKLLTVAAAAILLYATPSFALGLNTGSSSNVGVSSTLGGARVQSDIGLGANTGAGGVRAKTAIDGTVQTIDNNDDSNLTPEERRARREADRARLQTQNDAAISDDLSNPGSSYNRSANARAQNNAQHEAAQPYGRAESSIDAGANADVGISASGSNASVSGSTGVSAGAYGGYNR
jgi:hypothetical protein